MYVPVLFERIFSAIRSSFESTRTLCGSLWFGSYYKKDKLGLHTHYQAVFASDF